MQSPASACSHSISAAFGAALGLALLAGPGPAHAAGGPDGFGYTWIESADPGGPATEWVDVTMAHTQVMGLGDDNSAPRITLPRPFRYYWRDESQITIGSNGWVAFDPVGNIASCFPTIPTQGGAGDAYLAPLMGDLNFAGAGNPATAWTFYDATADRFIITYVDVPYWVSSAAGYDSARNTFQVILDYNDETVRFNYLRVDPIGVQSACVADSSVGIESPQGQYGLQVRLEVQPIAPLTIDFVPPVTPLISVIDPSVSSALNAASGGVFRDAGSDLDLVAVISNDADTATSGGLMVRGRLFDASLLFDQTLLEPDMAAGEMRALLFDPVVATPAGRSTFLVDISGGGDINPGNNARAIEIFGIDDGASGVALDYVGAEVPDAAVNWINSVPPIDNGAAVLVALEGPSLLLRQVSAMIMGSAGDCAAGYQLELRENDGAGGLPGTLLASIDVADAIIDYGNWQYFDLPAPLTTDADGFYIVWHQTEGCTLGASQSGVPSRRTLELLGGAFAAYRAGDTQDVFLGVVADTVHLFGDGLEGSSP